MAKRETVKNINQETGELEDVNLHFKDGIPKDGSLVFSGDITENINHKNIRIYPKKKKETESLTYEHPFWGTMVKMKNDRRHFKINYTIDGEVEFSSDTFYKYWYIITNNLYFNCNVVILKKPKIHPLRTVSEFCKLCDAGQATMYKFIKECKQKHYMGKLKMDDIYWVVNPKYARIGGDLPLRLLDLFQFGEDYINDNLKTEEEVMEEEE